MRGRSLLREPPGASICTFCAHRLGEVRTQRNIQRRFIQSSRPTLKPPAEETALREQDDLGPLSRSRSATISWGRTGPDATNSAGPIASWGRSSFGNGGIPTAGPAGSWGRPSMDGNSILGGVQSSAQPNSSNSTTTELLPQEQRARDLMLEKSAQAQRRPITIHAGPGPESTRAGRPQPWSEAERLARGNQLVDRRRMDGSNEARPLIRRHVMTDRESTYQLPRSVFQATADASQWTQLRRRGETSARDPPIPRDNSFAEGRARREEQARSGSYTPLGSTFSPHAQERSIPQQNPTSSSADSQKVTFRPMTVDRSSTTRGDLGNEIPHREVTNRNSNALDRFTSSAFRAQQDRGNFMERSSSQVDKEQDSRNQNGVQNREELQRGRISRFGVGRQNFDISALPKGKARDKAKRRQRFVESYDEESVAGDEELAVRAELRKQRKLEKAAKKAAAPTPILLPEFISVANLAVALRVRTPEFIRKMEELGFEETNHDHILNAETAGLIAMDYNFEPIIDRGDSEDIKAREPAVDPSLLPQRPPVVTIMGHVDHGKTTLLDWLRKSSVAATEHGGITQHIGAFSVSMPSGKIITFLDTPGHAAFLSMRQRGANMTDIVILVVAADDSVKPQTIEAINHAKAANVPIIVAINKIDKGEANIDRVKQDLARHGVEVEDFGGDTQVVCVSGKTGQGMEKLEEAAITLSEILDMRAEIDGQAEGWVIEASIKSMGKVATVLIKRGTVRPGDFIVAGNTWARIRCLRNEAGVEIEQAGPGTPVQIDGWREQPLAGDEVLQAPDEAKAKSVVEYRLEREDRDKMALDMDAINEHRKVEQEKRDREKKEALLAEKETEADNGLTAPEVTPGGPKQIYFIVKGDVSGSVEAVIDSIAAIGNKEVQPHILRSGVGQLSEFDVEHVSSAKGCLINFNTPIEPHITRLAENAKVPILDYNIIYRLVDGVKAELSKHLPPLITQKVLGEADIAMIFDINVKGRHRKAIAGCKVRNGTITKSAKVRVLRKGEKIFDGTLASLKNVKKDVTEMKKGSECGMGFEDWFDFQVGDQVQCYEETEEKRYL